jgi:photosystem II stability/assembly factor-like uncharacterized protein
MRHILLATTALLAAAPAFAATNQPVADSSAISGLGIRNIGSAQMSGRISALAARQEKDGKTTVFAGSASGGIWKSEDGGTTFRPVFDKQPVQSIGAIALDPTNDKVVWAGTGESWTRNSVSIGDGIYKSTDGGETWTNVGLPTTERIVKILVHPKDGNTVYVCAPGKLWSDSADRGLYKTTDGGRTWSHILKPANLSTGCSGVDMDPSNPDRLLAGTWDFRRKGWTFRSGGEGPNAPSGSRMLESLDGGRTWRELNDGNATGLPEQPWGRVEVTFAPNDPKRVYAFVENVRSALYVSEDGGKTFQERDRSQGMVWRPFYFGKIVVDPTNADRLFKMGYFVIVSEDGGKSFAGSGGASHADWHDIWINPSNPKHLIGGDDGGIWISTDGGSKWEHAKNLPLSQFYHVSVDDKDPYQVYGGLQDNSSWVGDQEYPGGVTNQRWENLYGGDGFWVFADPSDPDYVYAEYQGGALARINRKTLQQKFIQPAAGYKEKLRFNWNTPLHLSPHEKGTLYMGSQFLFRTRDQGKTWDRISPDLTTNDPQKQRQEESGGITVDNSAAEMHTTIYSISESPKAAGQIWVGTDDGNVQLTRDGGASWTNVTKNLKLPKDSWISWVEASRHDPAVAYVAVDRHMSGDMEPYLFRTADYGRTWKALIGPKTDAVRGYAHVVKEDRANPNILFVGTEHGLFSSVDGGANWAQFKPNNFPNVAVRDIAVQDREDDLVLATHGRGIWVIDDVSPLRALSSDKLAANAVLLPSAHQVQQRILGNGGWSEGNGVFTGENPPSGAVITYYQKQRHVIGRMKLEVLDEKGNVVEELPASKRKGLNRVVWSMRTKPPVVPPAASLAFNSTQGQRVLPGNYTVRLTKGGEVSTMPLVIGLDRRAKFTVDDRAQQYAAAERVKTLFGRMTRTTMEINGARQMAGQIAGKPDATAAQKAEAQAFSDKANAIRKKLVATTEGGAITGEERLRENMDTAYGLVTSTEERPTNYALARVDALEKELVEVEAEWAALKGDAMKKLQTAALTIGLEPFDVASIMLPEPTGGGSAVAVGEGLIGTRYFGAFKALKRTKAADRTE